MPSKKISLAKRIKNVFIGEEVDLSDRSVFQRLSLVAFLAWIGLGADGLSSSCYGPFEAFAALGEHRILALLVGFMSAVTIFIISASYSQIIELFPNGGGGYFVASKLISPKAGMFSGCALLIDYVLTIAISIASGADALISFLPQWVGTWKVAIALVGIIILTWMNLRGVKESIKLLIPVFSVFVLTHAFTIIYALILHAMDAPIVIDRLVADVNSTQTQLGTTGLIFLLLKSYSMGAGTYTGIEAVSNGMSMLREPRVQTGKRTMTYMAVSLAVIVMGLMMSYMLFDIKIESGKTLNASLLAAMTSSWPSIPGKAFMWVTLLSEALLLFMAAQTGFLGGPKILSNMALDRWFPTKFALLSDRLVTKNGILCFSTAAIIIIMLSGGSVSHLVVLYSINVFITFVLSQAGLARYLWLQRKNGSHLRWLKKTIVNLIGLAMSFGILCALIAIKFHDGAWITILVTGMLVVTALYINHAYTQMGYKVAQMNSIVKYTEIAGLPIAPDTNAAPPHTTDRTAVILVSGYNGLGMRAILSLLSYHGRSFRNIVFVQIGVVDSSIFQSPKILDKLKERLQSETDQYAALVKRSGFGTETFWSIGSDLVSEVMKLAPKIHEKYPKAIFFAGQIVMNDDSLLNRLLHNYQSFSLQRNLFQEKIPFELLPISLDGEKNKNRVDNKKAYQKVNHI